MSLRRSNRVQSQVKVVADSIAQVANTAIPSKKRARKVNGTTSSTAAITNNGTENTEPALPQTEDGFKIPATPSPAKKRQRRAPSTPTAPPLTPTPSAIGVMITPIRPMPSTGDIDDATPTRPASPHRTNAPLTSTTGARLIPSHSTSRPANLLPPPRHTTATLLEDAKAHLIKTDPRLRAVVEAHHCRVFDPTGLAEEIDPFRSLASGIMAQQVSGAAASAIKAKFVGLFPEAGGAFPSPETVAATELGRLREAGLSGRKAEYIKGLAEKFREGELSAQMLGEADDAEVMERLVAVRGLGAWSVEMFMTFGLKRMDVFSTGDLGVQRGMAALEGRDVQRLKNKGGKWKYMSEKDMLDMAETFRPYRSLFMWYMWRIESVPGQGGTNVNAIQDNA